MAPANERGEFDNYELFRWLTDLKAYVEDNVSGAITLTASQITSGVFDPARIPDLPFTRIQMTGRHLLGRTTDGLGDAEEITVTGGLTLAAGILRLTPVVPSAPIVTGMPLTVRDSDDGTDEARWAMAAVPRAVVGATGATGANGMDGADGVDGGYWPAPSSGVITTVTPTYVVGSGTNGNLALWQLSGSLGDGPAASNVPLLNATNTFTAFGTHAISAGGTGNQAFIVTNTTSGTTMASLIRATAGTTTSQIVAYSQGYTTGTFDVQASSAFIGAGVGGISLVAQDAAGIIRFYSGGANTMNLSAAGILTVLSSGRHIIGAGGTTSNTVVRIDGASGTALGSYISFAKNGTDKGVVGSTSAILGSGTSDNLALYSGAAGVDTYSNGLLRWGVNTAGDFTFGASSHLADSSGTPTISSGFGAGSTIAGTDYAIVITVGAVSTTGVINFGHTFSTAPVCVATPTTPIIVNITAVSTTQLTLTYNASTAINIYILVRGY